MKDLSRTVSMHCAICGNDQFSSLDVEFDNLCEAPDETKIQCSDCKNICTKAELIEENQETINANIEDIKEDAIEELKKELGKFFKVK